MNFPERRRKTRVLFYGVRLSVRGPNWAREISCLANDMSIHGLGLELSSEAPAVGDEVEILVELPVEPATTAFSGKVVWIANDRSGAGGRRAGVEFTRLTKAQRGILERALAAEEGSLDLEAGPFGCPHQEPEDVLVLHIADLIAHQPPEAIRRVLAAAVEKSNRHVGADAGDAPYLPTLVWGALVWPARDLTRRGRRLVLSGRGAGIKETYDAIGLEHELARFDDPESAVQALKG